MQVAMLAGEKRVLQEKDSRRSRHMEEKEKQTSGRQVKNYKSFGYNMVENSQVW